MKRTKKVSGRRHLRIYADLYGTEAFKTLTPSATKLWIDLRTQFSGGNNGDISAALSLLRHRGWASSSTLYVALGQLLKRGLIARTRIGKAGPRHVCSLYRFTELPADGNEAKAIEPSSATNDFLKWTEADTAKEKADAKAAAAKKNPCFENRSGTASKIEAANASTDSILEMITPSPIRKSKRQKRADNDGKAAPTLEKSAKRAPARADEKSFLKSNYFISRAISGALAGAVDPAVDPALASEPEVAAGRAPKTKAASKTRLSAANTAKRARRKLAAKRKRAKSA